MGEGERETTDREIYSTMHQGQMYCEVSMGTIDVLGSVEQRVGHDDHRWLNKAGFLEEGHFTGASKKELDSTSGK